MGELYLPLLFSALALASALIINLFSFFYFKSYLKRRTGQERILAEFRDEVNNILKSINEATDRDISLIEEREKNLKSLLNETEKRVNVYFREMDVRKDAEAAYAALLTEEKDKKPAATYESLGKNRFKTPVEPKQEAAPPVKPPSTREQIHSLLRSGLSETAIASRLGISISEVEFAAAMPERRDDK